MARRLIAVGHKKPRYSTLYETFSTRDEAWTPRKADVPAEPDYDEMRKQQIEQDIADGVFI